MEDLSPSRARSSTKRKQQVLEEDMPAPCRQRRDGVVSRDRRAGRARVASPVPSPPSPSPHATSSGACRCPPKSTDRSRLPPRAQCSGSNLLSWAMAARAREELMLAGRTARSSISTPERGELQSHWVPPALRRKPDSVPSSSADVTLLAAKMLSREREQSHVVA